MGIPYESTFVVLDMQTGLLRTFNQNEVSGSTELEALGGPILTRAINREVVENINRRSKEFRAVGSRVIFVNFQGEGRLLPDIDYNPQRDRIIEKSGNDAFYKTSLANILRLYGNKNLVFAGAHANSCLPATVGPAIEIFKPEGYRVYVAENCVISNDIFSKKTGLARMVSLGAELI